MKKILLSILLISFSSYMNDNNLSSVKKWTFGGTIAGLFIGSLITYAEKDTNESLFQRESLGFITLAGITSGLIIGTNTYLNNKDKETINRVNNLFNMNVVIENEVEREELNNIGKKTEKKVKIKYVNKLNSLDEPLQLDHEEKRFLIEMRKRRELTGQQSFEAPF